MLSFGYRGFFNSSLFNKAVPEFLDSLLPNIVRKYGLTSAKGGTARGFIGKLAETIAKSADMPYHIHILNGLLPALKLLEVKFDREGWLDQKESDTFLRCFIIGFTFHDINKLTRAENLNVTVENDLRQLCDELGVESFFAEWRDWIKEIQFLALGTEYRSKIHALQKSIREYEAFNTVFAEYCHLADAIASIDGFGNVAEFYAQLCRCRLDSKNLSMFLTLSYIEVQENLFTLLSQKLLLAARSVIQNDRKQTVLFKLRRGFVYLGEPLTKSEIDRICVDFKTDLSDVVSSAQMDFQSCKFGFLESLNEEDAINPERYHGQIIGALKKIVKAGYANVGKGNGKIRPLAINTYRNQLENKNQKPEEIHILEQLLDEYELPIKVIEAKQSDGKIQDYFLGLDKAWNELQNEHRFLELVFLEKIRIIPGKSFPMWKDRRPQLETSKRRFLNGRFCYEIEDSEVQKPTSEDLTCTACGEIQNRPHIQLPTIEALVKKFSKATASTIIAIISAAERRNLVERYDLDFEKYVEKRFQRIGSKLAAKAKAVNREELDNFVQFYLSGNFERDVESVLGLIESIPAKDNMCMFTGRPAEIKYGAERAFGFSALNFSNRSLNTLKSKDNKVSSLFLVENDLRQKELPQGFYTKKLGKGDKDKLNRQFFRDSSAANSAIYYDFGEYFVDVLTEPLLNVLSKAFSYDCQDIGGLTLVFDDYAYDYNLYGMNFNFIKDDVESNFYFIHQMLKLIERTCFRIFTTSILTPYHAHKEIFAFENCMPFVKALGWDKIRIDQVKERRREMNLLLSLNAKRLVSNLLNYAEDRRYLFTAYAQLKEEEQQNARKSLSLFVSSLWKDEKEELMSVMNNLAQIAVEMVRPKSGSTSQESWVIRDALKVLKDCYKEGRDPETTIEQIAGELRKTLKTREYANLSMCEPFADELYNQLFIREWKGHFPQPNRLRNWINQFAFLYSEKSWRESRKFKVRKAIKELQDIQREVTEDAVIENLVSNDKKLERYANDYREIFPEVFNEIAAQTSKEALK